MKYSIFSLILIISPFAIFAQSRTFNIRKIDSTVNQSLLKFYKPNPESYNKACIDGVVFIKFIVNKEGKIDQLEFSKGSPSFITDALKRVIKQLEKQRDFVSELGGTGKFIIKPFWYDYQNGCAYPTVPNNLSGEEFYKKHLDVRANKANYSTTLRYLLTFGDVEYNPGIDCILLSPATMGPVM